MPAPALQLLLNKFYAAASVVQRMVIDSFNMKRTISPRQRAPSWNQRIADRNHGWRVGLSLQIVRNHDLKGELYGNQGMHDRRRS